MSLFNMNPREIVLDARMRTKDIQHLKDSMERIFSAQTDTQKLEEVGKSSLIYQNVKYPIKEILSDEPVRFELKSMIQSCMRSRKMEDIFAIMEESTERSDFVGSIRERISRGAELTEGQLKIMVDILLQEPRIMN